MSNVKRYDHDWESDTADCNCRSFMYESGHGSYVQHDDYEALLVEYRFLRRRYEELQIKMSWIESPDRMGSNMCKHHWHWDGSLMLYICCKCSCAKEGL